MSPFVSNSQRKGFFARHNKTKSENLKDKLKHKQQKPIKEKTIYSVELSSTDNRDNETFYVYANSKKEAREKVDIIMKKEHPNLKDGEDFTYDRIDKRNYESFKIGGTYTSKEQMKKIRDFDERKAISNEKDILSIKRQNKNKLTNYERKSIKKSIKEEKKAQKDYKSRAKHSKNSKVKNKFNHIRKEERTHEKELNELL